VSVGSLEDTTTGRLLCRRELIVNADDFGRSPGINRGVLEAYQHGVVTSASLMTLWPASAAAADAADDHPGLGLGLHVDLGEWIFRDGAWRCTYLRVPIGDRAAITSEVRRQLRAFRRLVGRDPTHLDSHQHVHREEPVTSALLQLADELGVPLRHASDDVRCCGDFFGQTAHGERLEEAIGVDGLLRTLELLGLGTTELVCHPGYATDLVTAYRREREVEVRTLCDDRIGSAVVQQGFTLRSFASR
jgi:chitin disaccharide deacetylase